jgi:YHS domain-containing protein
MKTPVTQPNTLATWFKRLVNLALIVWLSSAALSGCDAMRSQNPGGKFHPVNAVAGPSGERLMLKGHDVVAYHTQGKHALGQSGFSSVVEGVSFWFASAEHKALFDKDPAKYMPAYGGYCANGIVYGIPWGGDADTWRMIDGKVYIFGGAQSKAGFELEPSANLALAEKYWKEEVQGNNSFVQRAKRLVLRVPHYKSGSELAAAIAAKPAASAAK